MKNADTPKEGISAESHDQDSTATTAPALPALKPKFEGIPQLLRELPCWLPWKKGAVKSDGSGRYDKIPCSAKTGKACNAHAPGNWVSFDEARACFERGGFDGIAIDLPNEREPVAFDERGAPLYLIGGDIDKCVENINGKPVLSALAKEVIFRLGRPYYELSPSGTGIRFFCLYTRPLRGGNRDGKELYSGGRFLTVTGRGSGAVRVVGAELEELERELFGDRQSVEGGALPPAAAINDDLTAYDCEVAETPENIERVKSALAVLPADCGYEEWRDGGFALHSLGWTCGFELFDRWSQTAPDRYEPEAVEKLWGSAKGGGITVATLFHRAKLAGWVDPRKAVGEAGSADAHEPWLENMRARYAWVDEQAGIYRIQHRDFISPEKFRLAHANDTQRVPDGRGGTKVVSVASLYLASRARRQHRAIVTRPAEPEVTADNCLNDWAGFAVEPAPGNVEPFERLCHWLFGDEQFPRLWLAHLIQHPGIKMFTSLVVWSHAQGVGKNLLFETVGALFSPHHYALISQSEVEDEFTGWIPGTVFVIADEIRAAKSDRVSDRLKTWATGTTLRTHDKGQPKRVVDNLMNSVFLSNHPDGMFLNDYDRRFAVFEGISGPLPEGIKVAFLAWRDRGGLAHLLNYLQSVDTAGFDPKGRAPVTAAKRAMIEAGRSDLDRWAHDLVSGAIPLGREIATAEELTSRFVVEYPHVRAAPSVAVVGKVFVRLGAYRRDNQVRLSNGRKVRALALLRPDHWKAQPESAWRDELEKRL